MTDVYKNNLSEPFIIEMKEMTNFKKLQDQKRPFSSEYVKPCHSSNNSTIEEENHYSSENSSPQNQVFNKFDVKRFTDGFFLNEELIQSDKVLTKADLMRFSMNCLSGGGIPEPNQSISQTNQNQEEYVAFNTTLTPTGYGFAIDYIYLLWNLYMNQFCKLLKFLGSIVGKLEKKYTSHNVGYAFMALSTILHVIPSLYVKMNPQIDFSVSLMARGSVTMFLLVCMAKCKNQKLIAFCKNDMKILITRGILNGISQLYFFFSVKKLPLSIDYVIFNTGPIFVFILSAILFGIAIKKKEMIGILVAFSGIICITNPGLIQSIISFGGEEQITSQQTQQSQFQYAQGVEKIILIVIFIFVYVGWAYAILLVKKVKEANNLAMNFYVGMSCFLAGAIAFYVRDQSISHLNIFDFMAIIFIVGLFSFGSQYTFITSTMLNSNHGPLSMLNYLCVVESYVVQILFFNEVPSLIEISGAILVLGGLSTILIKG
ncbi:integral membrane protein DUF6 containing protein (macronuclear) [Tetrahymena thermophila SB210]|uniref:Integral membrane protein DUF6 containing protein n=1 Tax=Tetrahymena thermophila (strain SB210) TaxID=312017 RepID=Q23FJ2_TETTS|nr:integral membrane protein DUF6 containing protein [Tetrahymena thermophila SB210]EAR95161.1 integral membrane protein DUF6 containing protein [Tetrahymena thermophila SB210]|eukprot:XP_001015406.1 integral membrane protein DUF6 containing protein [Tetrahymena thermophila SB210]